MNACANDIGSRHAHPVPGVDGGVDTIRGIIRRIQSVWAISTVEVVDHGELSVGIDAPVLIDLPVEHGEESSVVEVVASIVDVVHVAAGKEPQVVVARQWLQVGHVERLGETALVGSMTAKGGECRSTDAGIESFVKSKLATGLVGFLLILQLLWLTAIYDCVGGRLHGITRQKPVLSRAVVGMEWP